MKKLLTFWFVIFGLIASNVCAESFGTFPANQSITLIQTCSTCSYVNISSITAPNSTLLVSNTPMSRQSASLFNYTLAAQFQIGQYIVCGVGDLDGTATDWCYTFEVTSDGMPFTESKNILLGDNENILIFFAILLALILLWFGVAKEDVSIISFSAIIQMITGVFTLINGFSGLDNILTLAIGIVLIGVGGYIFIRANMDYFMELF